MLNYKAKRKPRKKYVPVYNYEYKPYCELTDHEKLVMARAGKSYKTRLRLSAIGALGGRCAKCGFTDIRALQIDHVDGGGNQLRKTTSYVSMYRDIIAGTCKYPVQLLCANCNWIKRDENNEMSRQCNVLKEL